MQRPGLPDRYIVVPRVGAWWVEFKWEDGELRADQRILLDAWGKAEVPCFVARFRNKATRLDLHSPLRHGALIGSVPMVSDPVEQRRLFIAPIA
jgi:hypothetical protein